MAPDLGHREDVYMRVAVIGIGGTGSAALRFLAEAGHEAVGYEQFAVGHDRGSSHGESRIIRYLYPDPLYTGLMRDAYPLWRDLEARAGRELLVTTGGIFIGAGGSADIVDTQASLEAAGCGYELLDSVEAARRFPDFQFSDDEVALYQGDTGFLRASSCVDANAKLAAAAGATIREGVRVDKIRQDGDDVLVSSSNGEQHFDRAIVTAGPWMSEVLASMQLPVRVSRQYVGYVGGALANVAGPGRFPAWIDFRSPEVFYGIPHDGRIDGVKLAMHQFGPTADPNALPDAMPPSIAARIEEYAAHRFRFAEPAVTKSTACLYTVTPDEDFIVDRVPSIPGVWMVSGCSGHGFKFTVLLGKIAAGLAVDGDSQYDLTRFSFSRFQV